MDKPQVILYRGIPGSGKTWAIEDWMHTFSQDIHDPSPKPYSADYLFNTPQGYKFDPKRIAEAHAWCFRQYLEDVQLWDKGEYISHFVIDNTNISAFEMAPYIQAANAYGLAHEIITIWSDPIIAYKRNTHGVPLTTIMTMYKRLLQEDLPTFWNHKIILPTEN